MKDGRLVSGSYDKSIIIYNKETYKPDLIIEEHKDKIICINQLRTGLLASCSFDKTIILFHINGKKYEIIQILDYHTGPIKKIIELNNNKLVSCSDDNYIIFYKIDNLNYTKDYSISTNGHCTSIIQTTENEICYSTKNKIYFYDIIEKNNKISIENISITDGSNGNRVWPIMINKELLLIPGEAEISIVNVFEHKLMRIVKIPDSNQIYGICLLTKNMLLIGDYYGVLSQWKIEGNNLIFISKKEKAHSGWINYLQNLEDGHIASCSDDKTVKIW